MTLRVEKALREQQPRVWTLESPGLTGAMTAKATHGPKPAVGERVHVIELESVLDLLERAAPQLSYAPPKMARAGEQPESKERWLRDEIEDFLRAHGRLPDDGKD